MPKHYLSHVKDYLSTAKGYLPQQYKDRPNIEGLLTAIIRPLQDIENKLYEIYRNYSLQEASDHYLDRIGTLVGESRNHLEDDKYRLAILARIMVNNAGATPEDIINTLKFTYNPRRLSYTEIYPACFSVFMQGNNINSSSKSLIKSIIPAGVSNFVVTYSPEDDPFIFAECSGEIVALETQINLGDDASDAEISTDDGAKSFDVVADTQLFPKGYMGFAEIIVAKAAFSIGEGDVYFVEDGIPLELIASLEDFKINGGSKLAEVIENG